jgi:hypothetical protein
VVEDSKLRLLCFMFDSQCEQISSLTLGLQLLLITLQFESLAEYVIVDGSLLMKDQSLEIFLIGICWFHNFLIISELCVP